MSKNFFTAAGAIDKECNRFNAESREFFEWKFKDRLSGSGIHRLTESSIIDGQVLRSTKGKKVCFIRFVERWKETNEIAGIVVLDRFVEIPQAYVGQYVFVTLNLETSRLIVTSEHQGVFTEIINESFEYTL